MSVLFFDIDGTLANGLDVPLSAEEAIAKARARGHLVFICTGRPLHYVRRHFSKYADGYVCFNGRFAILGEKVLYDCPLTEEELNALLKKMDDLGAGYEFFNNHRDIFGGMHDGKYVPFERNGEDVYNFNIYFSDREHYEKIKDALKDMVVFNPHGPAPHADATISGSDKGTAIREVLKALGIAKEDAYAFGDGANDISMLEAVGNGICMGNGLPETKQKASYVTTDINDDGIRNALIHYGLIDE